MAWDTKKSSPIKNEFEKMFLDMEGDNCTDGSV